VASSDFDDPADGLGHRHSDHQRSDEVEDGGKRYSNLGLEGPGVDDGGDGVAAIVKAVEEIEEEGDCDYGDECSGAPAHSFSRYSKAMCRRV